MRTAILQAAAELFAERGYNATSVRAVVEAAGCKKPTLYYYFVNKESLFLGLLAERTEHINRVVEEAIGSGGSVRERLLRGLHGYLDHVKHDPVGLKLLMTAERHPEQGQPQFDFDGLRQRHIDSIRALLEEGVAKGELRQGFDFDEAALALFGILDHRLVLYLHGRALPDDYPETLLDLFFHGVGAS